MCFLSLSETHHWLRNTSLTWLRNTSLTWLCITVICITSKVVWRKYVSRSKWYVSHPNVIHITVKHITHMTYIIHILWIISLIIHILLIISLIVSQWYVSHLDVIHTTLIVIHTCAIPLWTWYISLSETHHSHDLHHSYTIDYITHSDMYHV